MVASRWPYRLPLAASIRLSTSASVRYSRVRNSALGLRTGMATVRFTATGATSFRCDLAMVSRAPIVSTVRIITLLRTVSIPIAGRTHILFSLDRFRDVSPDRLLDRRHHQPGNLAAPAPH